MRHRDFQRIYDEFLNYYKQRETGESEYYAWLKALRLDEGRAYGACAESFRWAKDMLTYLREDKDNKYYQILLGFPLKSMNGNVYKERDLIAAAVSLKGKHPSLNHKDEFWFNPHSRYGTLTVVDAKYEDGAIETILQVPKTAVCPICDGKPMTELIDNKHIVNVSLEGDCASGQCHTGECEGFYFTNPPFTLLTTNVLPGIPLARIKPLESIMVEALQSSTSKGANRKVKVKAKVKEDAPTATHYSNVLAKVVQEPKPPTKDTGPSVAVGMSPAPNDHHFMRSGPEQITSNSTASPPNKMERVREPFADYADFDDCVAKNSDKDDPQAYCAEIKQQTETLQPSDPMPNVAHEDPVGKSHTSPPETHHDTTLSGVDNAPAGNTTMHPTAPHTAPADSTSKNCPEDHHWSDEDGKCMPNASGLVLEEEELCADGYHRDEEGNCVLDEPLDERVKRIKAETRELMALGESAKLRNDMAKLETVWLGKYVKLDRQLQKAEAYNRQQDNILKQQRATIRQEQMRCEDLRVEIRDIKNQFADATSTSNKYGHLVEDLKIENANLNQKYHGALEKNLELSKKLTAANEEYLDLAKMKEDVEDKLTKARTNAKKTLKLRI